MSQKSEIKINVKMDANHVPEQITWSASEAEVENKKSKAMLLSFWDEDEKNTLRVDLWTKEMYVDEMKQFFHQTLVTMTDTFERATNEKEMAQDMRDFCNYFGEKMKLFT